MNKIIKGGTFGQRIKAAVRAFQGKPAHTISLGLEIKRCSECEPICSLCGAKIQEKESVLDKIAEEAASE